MSKTTNSIMASSKGHDDFPLKSMNGTVVSAEEMPTDTLNGSPTRDEVELARFGKMQQLKVRLFHTQVYPISMR